MFFIKCVLIAFIIGAVARAVIKSITRDRQAWSPEGRPLQERTSQERSQREWTTRETETNEYEGKYRKKFLLTINEKYEHKKILEVINDLDLILLAKVRLADVIEPISGQKEWQTLFYKIQAKHLDFVVCTQSMVTLCAIEIDDSSHNRADRIARDNFVDAILKDVGIPVIRKISVNEQELKKELETMLQK